MNKGKLRIVRKYANLMQIEFSLPISLVLSTFLALPIRGLQLEWSEFLVVPFMGVLTLGLYVPYFGFRVRSPKHGTLHLILILLALCSLLGQLLVISPDTTRLVKSESVNLGIAFWVVFWLLALISSIISIPLYILSRLRTGRDYPPTVSDEEIRKETGIDQIESTIKSLGTLFNSFDQAVSQERTKLQETFARMWREFQSQEKAIEQVKREVDSARGEAKRYKKLADLSKEGQDTLLWILAKEKRWEYWIGLGTGFVSSLAVALLMWWLKWLFQNRP